MAQPVAQMSFLGRIVNKLFCSNNYYKSVQPMFFVTFLYGITPFRVVTDRFGCKSLKTSWYGYVNPILHVVSVGYAYGYTMYHKESIIGYFLRTDISNFGNHLHAFAGIGGASIVFISAIIRKRKLLRAVRILLKCDRHFLRVNRSLDYTVIMRFILLVMSVITCLDVIITATCFSCLRAMDVHPSPHIMYIFLSETLGISVSITLFCLLTRSVQRRIGLLNKVSQLKESVKFELVDENANV